MYRTTTRTKTRPLAVTVAVAAAWAVGAPAAAVASDYVPTGKECTRAAGSANGMGPALVDAAGYSYESTSAQSWSGGRPSQYATLSDVKASPSLFGRLGVDAYDDWGDLFVGSGQSDTTQYVDSDPLGCTAEPSGQLAFASVTIGGLTVQRKLFAPRTAGSGIRILQSVTNPGPEPVSTNVYVGDLTATLTKGTLGSDALTRLEATSSGDATLTTADRWAVTSDGIFHSDPVLAHVWDGEGGETRATLVRSGAQGGTLPLVGLGSLWSDQLGYGWKDVQIKPGETASFVSWEIPRVDAAGGADETAAAKTAAASRVVAPASTTYEGLTAPEVAAVRNWAKPQVRASIAEVDGARAGQDTTLRATGVDFGVGVAQCAAGTLTWDFGDGTTATGAVVQHRFVEGRAKVTLQAKGACGGVANSRVELSIAAAPEDQDEAKDPQPSPTTVPAPAAVPSLPEGPGAALGAPAGPTTPALALSAPERMTATTIARKGIDLSLAATAPGAMRIVLSGGGVKLVKRMTLRPGELRTPTFKLSPADAAKVRRIKTLQVRAKLTLDGGAEIIETRTILVRR